MLKAIVTLVRGFANRSADAAIDRHALIILDQQMRDGAQALNASRQALALAMAQDRAEIKRTTVLRRRIADLEARAVEALKAGREDLAEEVAESLAGLEADAAAGEEASRRFAAEAARLRLRVAKAERRLSALERGRRIAHASEAVGRLKASAASDASPAPLAEAEAMLKRLEARQSDDEAASEAVAELDADARAAGLSERLAEEGFGARLRPKASDVMERLRHLAGTADAPAA